MYKYSFEKLEVWMDARAFVTEIYSVSKTFPTEEKYLLCSQMQRAAISIVSNIAEGVSRTSPKEKSRFIEIAYGSLMETYCQLCIALDLKYITKDKFCEIKETINKIANKLNALNRYYKNKIPNKTQLPNSTITQ